VAVTALTAADDSFHPPASEDPAWTETCWFAAQVPERALGVWLYPLFRPNLRIMSCGIYVWEKGSEEVWQLPYYRTWWHLPFPEGQDLVDLHLSNGLSYRRLEPLTSYHATYRDADAIEVELVFTALHPPHELGIENGRGHFDQLCRVEGEVTLYGERIGVDAFDMRDRTWGLRRENRQRTSLGYSFGTNGTTGFHCSTLYDAEAGEYRLMTGFILDGGATDHVVEAVREVERDALGRPVRLFVRGADQRGRHFEASGEVVSRMAMPSTPWFNWVSIVRWRLPDGSEGWGEDQETWSPERQRRLLRGRAPGGPAVEVE